MGDCGTLFRGFLGNFILFDFTFILSRFFRFMNDEWNGLCTCNFTGSGPAFGVHFTQLLELWYFGFIACKYSEA